MTKREFLAAPGDNRRTGGYHGIPPGDGTNWRVFGNDSKLAMHEGNLIGLDGGIYPRWPNHDSPAAGPIFRIDFI